MSQSDYRAEVEKAIRMFEDAAKAKDADAIAGLYGENATLLPPERLRSRGVRRSAISGRRSSKPPPIPW